MKNKYFLGIFLCIIGLFLYFFYAIYTEAKEKAIAELNSRQTIHAKQAKKGIEEFFNQITAVLTKISKLNHIIELNDQGRNEITIALNVLPDAVTAISRVDASGKITFSTPFSRNLIGRDISGQKHIQKIMKTHRPVVSDVFTAVQGYNTIALHVPIFNGNEFSGTLGVLIDFRPIAKRFLQEIRVGETGYAWVTSKEGIELYCPVPGHTGKSVFENCKNSPTILSIAKKMVKGEQGTASYLFNQIRDKQQEIIKKHAVYMPINIGDNFWSIVIASSEDEVLSSLANFKNKLIVLISLLLICMVIFFYYGIRAWGIVRESTKQKKTEKALLESEEKFRSLFNNAEVGMFRTKLDGSEMLDMNERFLKIFGRTREEMLGKPSAIYWSDLRERQEMVHRLEAEGRVTNFECSMFTKQGETRQCLTSLRVDRERGILEGSIIDITERKRLEKELLRAQKLESVGLLAGGIAHDFNNFLTTIIGNVSMAKSQVPPGNEIFEMLNEAETASTRAQTLTKQLLTFAKGGSPIKGVALVKDILKESCNFVLRGSKSISTFTIAEDLWPAEVDVGQMNQVINNIVINANQAMPEGGIIHVSAENMIIDDGHSLPIKPGRYIRISIKDQGVGIGEKHLLNIFDPYFTTKQNGSGLGLATTYSIIKKHDGHITVESQLGVGTTFHIYLPASDQAVPKKEEVNLIKGQGRILVMDDEASLRKIFGRMLKNLGYESDFAKNGAEAIQKVKEAKEAEKHYDAVILDLTIPGGMGGKEAIKKLLEIDPEVKAIVTSGYSNDPVLANYQEYGFKGMMPKPFESKSLSKVLHEVLKA